ncbi:DNA topoisomerase 2-binding protein 1 [Ischnura elegans]|uniref:DNA topoisomerase 2-binding protein 1 n=1 Tax=Ischnura elegans TaxID=197161 RepID=UPI001ED877B3|nr:DNA topoisomerase 2-binding protein 1 [Ischnura elegans]
MSESITHKKISVVFVLGDGVDKGNVSNDMKAAHQCCADQEVSTAWISWEECFKLSPKKTDIFVFDEFTGKAFEFLKDFKCVIIGPRCLMTCLLERKPIPNIPSPIISIAMVGVVATATGFTKEKKKNLSEKIGLMGGIYLNAYNASVTHLIADGVGSQKYKVAVERKVPIMTEEWVSSVWESGLTENVCALDPQFSHFKLPAFKGIVVCASQITKKDKQNLMKLVTGGGGQYSPQLDSKETGVLVIGDASGTKFTFAKKWGIPCVTPQWVYDSSACGLCLPFESYAVEGEPSAKALCSTPEAGKTQDALPDFSMCSTIAGDISRFNVNETVNTDFSAVPEPRTPRKGNGGSKDYIDLVNKLDVTEAKKAGSFLDGCKIYLSGFNPSQVEKLRKIINGGGATRFHQITESVSHVIVGEFLYEEIKSLKSGKFRPFVVSVDWLLESMRLGRVADEEKFLCFDLKPLEQPSPLSKKGLQLLQGRSSTASPMIPVKMARLEAKGGEEDGGKPLSSDKEKELVQKYLGVGASTPEKSSAVDPVLNQENCGDDDKHSGNLSNKEASREDAAPDAPPGKLFHGLKFVVAGFDGDPDEEDAGEEIRQMLTELGGQVMVRRFRGIPDYGIVPVEGGQLPCTVGEVITPLWLEDCNDQGKIVPVEYYHRPFVVEADSRPLEHCVIGISTYSGKERLYISSLAETLGAYSQEVFSKKDIPEKNAVASTHLICPTPEGNKYAAAVKWGLPAVTKDWILMCAQKGQKVPEADYYVVKSTDKPSDGTSGNTRVGQDLGKEAISEKSTPSVSEISKSNANASCEKSESNVRNNGSTRQISDSRLSVESAVMAPASTSMSARTNGGNDVSLSEKSLPSRVDGVRTVEGEVFTPPSRFSRVCRTPVVDARVEEEVGSGAHCFEDFASRDAEGKGAEEESEGSDVRVQRLQSTPGTPYGQVFEANPSRSTRKAWKNWVETIPKLHQPTPPHVEKKPETPLSELKRRLWASIDNACKKMELRLDDGEASSESGSECTSGKRKRPIEPEEASKKVTKPFAGVVAYIWKQFPKAKREQLAEKVDALGGVIQHSFSDVVTHAIFQGEECESSDEYQQAMESGKMLVAPAWVELCAAEGVRKDEALFPPSDYPLRCSAETPVDWESLKSKSQALHNAPRQIASTARVYNNEEKNNQQHESPKPFRKPEVHMQLKKLDSVLAEEIQSTPEKVRLSRAASNAAASWEDRVNSYPDAVGSSHGAHQSPRAAGGYYAMGNPPSPSTQSSGSEVISWQENGMIDEGKRETRIRNRSKAFGQPETETRITPKFMFSSMDEAEKMRYKSVVENLGGQVCVDTNFDTSATHLITLRPARSEKLLGSIASGIWVLHPKYLDASVAEGAFVEEEAYEWGNPSGLVPMPTVEIERILSAAIHRWRVKIKGGGLQMSSESRRGAFEGMCAIVHMVEERAGAFRRLIVAGGGTISEATPPYTSATDATICLMEPGRSPGTKADVESLARKGIHCVKPLYLNECLMRVEAPDPLECAIPDYIAALEAQKE